MDSVLLSAVIKDFLSKQVSGEWTGEEMQQITRVDSTTAIALKYVGHLLKQSSKTPRFS